MTYVRSTPLPLIIVAGTLAFILMAAVPAALGQEAVGIDGAFTHEAIWLWEGRNPAEPVLLAGVATRPGDPNPQIAVVWSEDRSGWFPTPQVQLVVSQEEGRQDVHTLLRSRLNAVEQLAVHLSAHPEVGLISVALYDTADPQPLAVHAVSVDLPAGPWYPTGLARADGPQLASSTFLRGYRPVSTRLDVGERTGASQLIPLTTFQPGGKATVRVNSVVAPPGMFRLQAVAGPSDDPRILLSTDLLPEDVLWLDLPVHHFPPGPVELVLEYLENEEVKWRQRKTIRIGSADFRIGELVPEYEQGVLTAQLSTAAEAELPDVQASVRVRYTELVWDAAAQAHVPVGEVMEHAITNETVDTLRNTSPYLLQMPLPPHEGVWQVDFDVVTEPEIHVTLVGGQDILSYNRAAADYLIAVTDQASGRILVLDPAVADWNDPRAVRWSWSPADAGSVAVGWGLPSGVKLRRSEVWGGEWMLVVDSRGLAAIVPYPAGDRYQWLHVIDGNLHSAELLPDGNIALAASTGGWVRIYTSSQGTSSRHYVEYPLPGAHGVLWDPTLELLWAVGDHHLVGLRVLGTPEAPELETVIRSELPTPWGHDLSPVYGDPDRLWVSTNTRVYQYIKSTDTWVTQFAGGNQLNLPYVKGVGNQPSGRVALTQQKAGTLYTWTTDTVTLLYPYATRTMDGAAFYKARIWSPEYQ